jgi:hypothetical protein
MSAQRSAGAAASGRELALAKLREAITYIESPRVTKLIDELDNSPEARDLANIDLNRYLEQHGVPPPEGIEFVLEPVSAGMEPGQVAARIRVVLYKRLAHVPPRGRPPTT